LCLRIARLLLPILFAVSAPNHSWAQNPSSGSQPQLPGIVTKGLVIAKKPYEPITAPQRAHWLLKSTVGPESLIAGMLSAGVGTARDDPPEYGASWRGFGQRYGIRLTGVSTGNVIEAGLGAIWGEDPRYERLPEASFEERVRNVIKLTFAARYPDGHWGPAYARLIAIPANNMLSDAWRPPSETHAGDTALRSLMGLLGRMSANAFVEFWPDVRRLIRRSKDDQ
jgi:hypothetical protein